MHYWGAMGGHAGAHAPGGLLLFGQVSLVGAGGQPARHSQGPLW